MTTIPEDFFLINRGKDERIDKVINSEDISIGKIGYETWLGADIMFERQPNKFWDITIYRRLKGTPLEVTLLLASLVSISRRTKAWYEDTKKPFNIEVRDFLIELNIKKEKEIETAENVLYSIRHGIDYAFETHYALEKKYLTVDEVSELSKYYQQTSISIDIAFQFLASMAALRKSGHSVSYFNDLLIKRKRYDMLQMVDFVESNLEEKKVSFDKIKEIFKVLYPNIDKMKKDIKDISKEVLSARANNEMTYHLALSFAGEDRAIADKIAYKLSESNYSVFYDDYEKDELWGKDLYIYLNDLYSKRARYCLMVISENYRNKLWTNHERRAAQAKAFKQNEEYILPLRLDNTEIPGLNDTIGYVDYNKIEFEDLISLIKRKLNK